MEPYRFDRNLEENEILSCNKKPIEDIMDSEDSVVIYTECEILEILDDYINSNDLDDETEYKLYELKDLIKDKIERDVELYMIEDLV